MAARSPRPSRRSAASTSSSPTPASRPARAIEETTLAEWNRNHAILGTGYFLVAREAFRLLREQGRGGSIVFVASKNALVAGKNAAAYSSAKAAELHLARCLAEEGGRGGHPRQHGQPRRGAPGLAHLGLELARGARGRLRHRARTSSRSTTASAPRSASTSSPRTSPRRCMHFASPTRARARARATCSTSTAGYPRRTRGDGVALFITCFNDTLFPRTGQAVVELLERLGHEVEFPEEQTCCGQMHVNTGYARRGLALARAVRAGVRRLRGGRLAVGLVRRDGARALPGAGGPRVRADRVPGRPARRRGRRRDVPAPRHAAPDLPLAAAAAGRRPAAAAAGGRAGDRPRGARGRRRSAAASAGRSRSRTPTRRWRCSPTSCGGSSTRAPRCARRPTTPA